MADGTDKSGYQGDLLPHDAISRKSGYTEAFISGGAAGDHTVTGIDTRDELLAVYEEDATSGKWTDLTSEFTITAADTINNGGGTATTGDKLLVKYWKTTGD